MTDDFDPRFDRISWRDGQLLTAHDLRDDKRRDDCLRWLHTAFLHDTWGIALGFSVSPSPDDAALTVGPGYAVTVEGFDIVLSKTVRFPVPGVSGPASFVLTVGFTEDAAFRHTSVCSGLCLGEGPDGRHERPAFHWRLPEEVRFGPEIPLAKIMVAEGRIQGRVNTRVRRRARPLARPFLGAGSTDAGNTGWRDRIQGTVRFVEATVETGEAGFTGTPSYFARLRLPDSAAGGPAALALDALTFISNPGARSFTFAVLVEQSLQPGLAVSAESAERRRLTIDWVGIEPVIGCEPSMSSFGVFDPAEIDRVIL